MADSKIIKHFQKGISLGFSRIHIKESLINKGYPKQEVEVVERMLAEEEAPSESVKKTRQREWNTWYLLFILVIIALLFWINSLRSDEQLAVTKIVAEQPATTAIATMQQENRDRIVLIKSLAEQAMENINPAKEQITEEDINAAREKLQLIHEAAGIATASLDEYGQELR